MHIRNHRLRFTHWGLAGIGTGLGFAVLVGALGAGCGWFGNEDEGKGRGGSCVGTWECADPWVCAQDGTCQEQGVYPGTGDRLDDCASTADCRIDLVCGSGGFCTDPGHAAAGEACAGTEDCEKGLICAGDGVCKAPGEQGTLGDGEACAETGDCELGLFCGADGLCHRLGGQGEPCAAHEQCRESYYCGADGTCTPRAGAGESCTETAQCDLGLVCESVGGTCAPIPLYPGVGCADPAADPGPFRALFEVPRGDISGEIEFYRLPFPNDVRLRDGRVDLGGHPDPGALVPGEVVTKYLRAIEQEMDGFGVNTTSFVRFSQAVDFGTLTIAGEAPALSLVDIDPDSPGYGERHPAIGFSAASGRGKYICHNWVGLYPMPGYPLRHGTTYALIVRTRVTNEGGDPAGRDDDFQAMLASAPPADADLAAAWDAYGPLRDFLADTALPVEKQVAEADVAVAAVFSTLDPDARLPAFRHVVRTDPAVPAPVTADETRCATGIVSPCDDGLTGAEHQRGCFNEDPRVHEIHGTLTTPVFQQGQPPYTDTGGDIAYSADGTPLLEGEQPVCYGLSVPKGAAMPAEGWPVVIFLHGTGGSFRSHFNNQVAQHLASVDLGGGLTTGFAVIGIDQVVHGARREGDPTHPNQLFFNFANPPAAKNNTLQGAADLFQLVRVVQGYDVTVPGVGPVRFDPDRIYFFGHSQGSITGPPAVAFEPAFGGVIYSGAGGVLIESLLHKTSPVDIAGSVQLALADGNVGFTHPVLNLLQLYFEPVDTVNYAAPLFLAPVAGLPARHTLLSYGVGDTYTPNETGVALIRAAGAHLVRPVIDPISYVGEEDAPVRGNRWGGTLTEGVIQLAPDGDYDGHFVLTHHPDGVSVYTHFLGTLATDPAAVPTIPAWD